MELLWEENSFGAHTHTPEVGIRIVWLPKGQPKGGVKVVKSSHKKRLISWELYETWGVQALFVLASTFANMWVCFALQQTTHKNNFFFFLHVFVIPPDDDDDHHVFNGSSMICLDHGNFVTRNRGNSDNDSCTFFVSMYFFFVFWKIKRRSPLHLQTQKQSKNLTVEARFSCVRFTWILIF